MVLVVVVGLILTAVTSTFFRTPLLVSGIIGTVASLVLLVPISTRLRAVWYDTHEGHVEAVEARLEQGRKPVLVDASGRRLLIGRRLAAYLGNQAPCVCIAYVCHHTRRVVGISRS